MRRLSRLGLALFTLLMGFTATAWAHMVLVVPQADGKTLFVILSDDLEPDENVKIEKIQSFALKARTGTDVVPVVTKVGKHELTAQRPAQANVLFGTVQYGALKKGSDSFLLAYHAKFVAANTTTREATVGTLPAEIVPLREAGKTRFLCLAQGKPVANAEVSITLPDGSKTKAKTNAEGLTETYAATGRYAAYFKHSEAKSGELDQVAYTEIRHYGTLVTDVQ